MIYYDLDKGDKCDIVLTKKAKYNFWLCYCPGSSKLIKYVRVRFCHAQWG